jgi:hypothetical protein
MQFGGTAGFSPGAVSERPSRSGWAPPRNDTSDTRPTRGGRRLGLEALVQVAFLHRKTMPST